MSSWVSACYACFSSSFTANDFLVIFAEVTAESDVTIPLTCSVFMFGTIEDTPSIIRTGHITMVNMSAKFDDKAHNSLVPIIFTRIFPYMSIVTLTFDLQN